MAPNIATSGCSRTEIETINEDQPLFDDGGLAGSVPLTDLIASLSNNNASKHATIKNDSSVNDDHDDDTMSSIGIGSTTGSFLGHGSLASRQQQQQQQQHQSVSGIGSPLQQQERDLLQKSIIDTTMTIPSQSERDISTLGSESISPPGQPPSTTTTRAEAITTTFLTPLPTNKADLKKWLSRKSIMVLITCFGLLCQYRSGGSSNNQTLVETIQILISPPTPPAADENPQTGTDLPLIKFHKNFATPVLNDGAHQLQTTFNMMQSFSEMILKMTHHTGQSWPYVHIPEFEQRTEALLQHHRGTGTLIIKSVALAPLVTRGELYSFGIFQDTHVDDHSRYAQAKGSRKFSPLPRSSRQLSANGGHLEYHQFIPFQKYLPLNGRTGGREDNSANDANTHQHSAEWFQIAHIKAALNTIQKTEAPVLLLGRKNQQQTTTSTADSSLASDYILQPILDQVLVKKRLLRKNVWETQVVAVLAAQVQFVEAVQQSMQQHFPTLGLKTAGGEEDARSVLVLLRDTCNLEVSYKVAHGEELETVAATTTSNSRKQEKRTIAPSTVEFLGLGTYHKDDWGVASRQVHWSKDSVQEEDHSTNSNNQHSSGGSGGHSTGTPFCFPDGVQISLYPTPELHNALAHHFTSKLCLLGLVVATILYIVLLISIQGFVCVLILSGITAICLCAWSKVYSFLDEQDMETMLSRAMVDEINDKMSKKEQEEKAAATSQQGSMRPATQSVTSSISGVHRIRNN